MYKESLKIYLDDLASRKPAPGGGSAAALTAATGVSLISMVAHFTLGKEKYKPFEREVKVILSSAEVLRRELLELVDEDIQSYEQLASAYKLPQDSTDDKKKRQRAIQKRLKQALATPLEVCKRAHSAIKLCPAIAEKGNINLLSDVTVAVVLLEAAFQSALVNVEVNLKGLEDKEFIAQIRAVLTPLREQVCTIKDQLCCTVKNRP